MNISFDATPEERVQIDRVVDRALAIEPRLDEMSLTMDLTAVHANGCPLDFDRLLSFDDRDFVHDVAGIMRHIDRGTGRLVGHFLPRCARPYRPTLAERIVRVLEARMRERLEGQEAGR